MYLNANSSAGSDECCFMALNSAAKYPHFESVVSWNSSRKCEMKDANCCSGGLAGKPSVVRQKDERGHLSMHCYSRRDR